MIWDNGRVHTSKAVEEFIKQHEEDLFILNLPPYSPMSNPQKMYEISQNLISMNIKQDLLLIDIKDFI